MRNPNFIVDFPENAIFRKIDLHFSEKLRKKPSVYTSGTYDVSIGSRTSPGKRMHLGGHMPLTRAMWPSGSPEFSRIFLMFLNVFLFSCSTGRWAHVWDMLLPISYTSFLWRTHHNDSCTRLWTNTISGAQAVGVGRKLDLQPPQAWGLPFYG